MLLPQGTEKHKNLSTSFTRFDQLLHDLSENRFSGYIRLNFWSYEGVLVLDTGHIAEAYSTDKEVYLTGEQAVLRILLKASEADGDIEVHELSSELSLALAYALQASEYKDQNELSNYSLAQIFDLLERELITGYVDIQFSGKRGFGTVYYLEGTPVEAVVMSNTGKIVSGENVFHKFLEIGELIQPFVKIHRVVNPNSIREEEAFLIPWQHEKYIFFWRELLHYMHQLMSGPFKRENFYLNFKKACQEISDHYPFLNPEKGEVILSKETFAVTRILHHATFVQGMAVVLNRMLKRLPTRKIRKLNLEQVIADIKKLGDKNDVNTSLIEHQRLVAQMFRGILS